MKLIVTDHNLSTSPATFTLRVYVNDQDVLTESFAIEGAFTSSAIRTAIRAKLLTNSKLIMLHRVCEALGQNLETG